MNTNSIEEAAEDAWLEYEYSINGSLYSTCFKDAFKEGAAWQQSQPVSDKTVTMWKYNKEKHSVYEFDLPNASHQIIPVAGKVDWKDGEDVTGKFKIIGDTGKLSIGANYDSRLSIPITIQDQPHPKDWLIFTGEIDNIPEPQSQEQPQADKWGKYPHLSKWKSDYNEAIQKDITLPQYQKKFGEWMDNWIKENQSQEQQPVSDIGDYIKVVSMWDLNNIYQKQCVMTGFKTSAPIPEDKFPLIKKAIEQAINNKQGSDAQKR